MRKEFYLYQTHRKKYVIVLVRAYLIFGLPFCLPLHTATVMKNS